MQHVQTHTHTEGERSRTHTENNGKERKCFIFLWNFIYFLLVCFMFFNDMFLFLPQLFYVVLNSHFVLWKCGQCRAGVQMEVILRQWPCYGHCQCQVWLAFPRFSIVLRHWENDQHMPQHSFVLLFCSQLVQMITVSILYQWSSCHCWQKSSGPLWAQFASLALSCSSSVPSHLHTKCVFLTCWFLSRVDCMRCLLLQFEWFPSVHCHLLC